MPDPEIPDQLRDIDVTIKRDNALTLIECRIHKNAQDVQWIEKLIGKRLGMRADAVIAVSASGFTRGALAKGSAHGILLRTLRSIIFEITHSSNNVAIAVDPLKRKRPGELSISGF